MIVVLKKGASEADRAQVIDKVTLLGLEPHVTEGAERTVIGVADEHKRLSFTLVAGLIARRIVCRVQPGQPLAAGERAGLIRFGSRTELLLPPTAELRVGRRESVRGGRDVIAQLPRS